MSIPLSYHNRPITSMAISITVSFSGSMICQMVRIIKSISKSAATIPNSWWSLIMTCEESVAFP